MAVWYLNAADDEPRTNAYLVQVVGESNMENAWTGVCADGRPRDLYECPNGWADVRKAIAAVREFGLKLEVFKKEGDSVPMRFDLWKQPILKKAKRHKRSALMHKAKKPRRRVSFVI